MPLYKFGANDIFYNRIRTYPSSSFYIYSASVFYQDRSTQRGNLATGQAVPMSNKNPVQGGFDPSGPPASRNTVGANLSELNIDRTPTFGIRIIGPSSSVAAENVIDVGQIYQFIYKGGEQLAPKNYTRDEFNLVQPGEVLASPQKASAFPAQTAGISRRFYLSSSGFNDANQDGAALRNSLDFAKRFGTHYNFPSGASEDTSVIYIPSIFYGSAIKKGSVDLRYYMTGTLVARCTDSKYNGALIMSGNAESNEQGVLDGQTVGVVLYNEGVIILTSSVNVAVAPNALAMEKGYSSRDLQSTAFLTPGGNSWLYFGQGLTPVPLKTMSFKRTEPAGTEVDATDNFQFAQSASFGLQFAGTHDVPTVTMLASAKKGELNYSNNPTFKAEYKSANRFPITGSNLYHEQPQKIKDISYAPYSHPTGTLNNTTYIAKIGIYDDKKRLIGIASVAKPVKKTEDRDLTFKLKLDI